MARVAVVWAVFLAFAGTAFSLPSPKQPDPPAPKPKEPTLTVAPTRVHAGAVLRIRGTGCARGDRVTVLSAGFAGAGSSGLGSVRTRAKRSGSFEVTTTIPKRKSRGRYAVVARCNSTELGALAWFRVV